MRSQCKACPWRDLEELKQLAGEHVLEAARDGHVFVCHTRCGPCPGPILSGVYVEQDVN
jgi:hypothetical protein